MTDYSMPVLSEQEREELIKHNTAKINALTPQFMKEKLPGVKRHLMCELNSAKIALAALTSPAMGVVDRGEHDDCGSHPDAKVVCLHDQADWENFTDGTLLYLSPPVPAKQEGEQ